MHVTWNPGALQIEAVDGANIDLFPGALQRAAMYVEAANRAAGGTTPVQGSQRQDAAVIEAGGIHQYYADHWKEHAADPRWIAASKMRPTMRQDADGFHFARELEHIYAEIVKQPLPDLNGLMQFAASSEVPFGARTHTQRVELLVGEAEIWRGAGNGVTRADAKRDEQSFPVRYIVGAAEIDIFEQASSDFANSNLLRSRLEAANRAIDEKDNALVWGGDTASGLLGVLTYPGMPKATSAVAYTAATSATDIINDLNFWSAYAENNTRATMTPTRCATSPRIKNFLMQTARASTSDKTLGKFWLENQARIKSIDAAWELQDPDGDGLDIILFYNDDKSSVKRVSMPKQMLPVQRNGFVDTFYMFKPVGGVIQIRAGANLAVKVSPPVAV